MKADLLDKQLAAVVVVVVVVVAVVVVVVVWSLRNGKYSIKGIPVREDKNILRLKLGKQIICDNR